MAQLGQAVRQWLETRWVAPAYAGGLLLGLAIAFFGAAVNSMAGWLYAISGVMLAVAMVNIGLSPRSLRGLQVHRAPIRPTSVGEPLTVEVTVANLTARPKVLLQMRDDVPPQWGPPPTTAIAVIAAHQSHPWVYTCRPQRRGVYQWQTLTLRTAAPFGLFWCQRPQTAIAHATVYPEILPLTRCPLIDRMGTASGVRWQASRQSQNSHEGLTRAVRPYRWGDPTRLIHWRTSARYGELRMRELENLTADNQVLIGLDTSDRWSADAFEAAIVAAASLYIYSLQRQLEAALWLPHTGLLHTQHTVLSALAAVTPAPAAPRQRLPAQAMLWLGPSGQPPQTLPPGSLWVQWREANSPAQSDTHLYPTVAIAPHLPLIEQLQADIPLGTAPRGS
ncbi:MAG TPA: DUF58 domain-containing protein [Candidatus Obscuribacterales bacterium]